MQTVNPVSYVKKNLPVIVLLSAIIFGLSIYVNTSYFVNKKNLKFYPPFVAGVQHTANTLLGGEYYAIAEALASGKGFSNPFHEDTGPTAWQPPVYPVILAAFLKIFHSKRIVALCIIFIKNIVLILTGVLVYETAKNTLVKTPPKVALISYILWLLCFFRWFFQFSHDAWILLLLINVVFVFAASVVTKNKTTPKTAILWGVLGGIIILTSPIAGLVWLALLAGYVIAHTQYIKLGIASLMIAAILCAPWVIRNYLVFDQIILMKSNFFFDVYHNNQTPEGIVYAQFEIDNHPYFTVPKSGQSLYEKVGETEFMNIYKQKFLKDIKQHPYKYITNIKNRFLAALIRYYPYTQHDPFLYWKNLFHILPFASIIIIIALGGLRFYCFAPLALIIYMIYLTPYIMISFYTRYTIPLTQIKVLLILWAIDLLYIKISQKKSA